MTYRSNTQLPESIKSDLPPSAQDIYRSAFNSAWQDCQPGQGDSLRREQTARKVAWAAVRRRFEKVGEGWRPKH